jgi:thiosulfate/3-mercaptopyruvate sulfurtransferase
MGTNGLTAGMTVVAYGMYAARLVFLLNLIGHRAAFVLDGHIEGWLTEGYPVTRSLPNRKPTRYAAREELSLLVEASAVKKRLGDPALSLIDVRAPERFRGVVEPLDKVAGHIPGAVNVPWERNFDDAKKLRPADELAALYAPYTAAGGEPILYCGSGVTSCNTFLALREIGIPARLYAGSWSDWISYPGNPVATGEG